MRIGYEGRNKAEKNDDVGKVLIVSFAMEEGQIYSQVWKEPYYRAEDNVMSLIRRIRKKIEPDPSKPIYVLTVWGIGYKFNNAIKRK